MLLYISAVKDLLTQQQLDSPQEILSDASFTQLMKDNGQIASNDPPISAPGIVERASIIAGIHPRSNSSITANPIASAVANNSHGLAFATINMNDLNASSTPAPQSIQVAQSDSSTGSVHGALNMHNPRWKQLQVKAREKRDYFSYLVVNDIFTEQQLRGRNCSGICAEAKKKGRTKGALDAAKLTFVYDLAFHLFPLKGHESLSTAWTKCQDNINSRLRGRFGKENYLDNVVPSTT